MRILGINGILSKGKQNTDLLLEDLAAHYSTVDTKYPLRHIWQTRSRSQQYSDAKRLLNHSYNQCDAVIAHSYGCLVNLRMMELGARFSKVFWFRPAMNRDYIIPMGAVEKLYAIHSPRDRAIALGANLPWHDFGSAGRYGLLAGEDSERNYWDPRVQNIQAPDYEHTEFWRHSDDFLEPNRGQWVTFVNGCL